MINEILIQLHKLYAQENDNKCSFLALADAGHFWSPHDFLKSWHDRITTVTTEEANMGIGPKNHNRKLTAK